jgi:hypothetical protein
MNDSEFKTEINSLISDVVNDTNLPNEIREQLLEENKRKRGRPKKLHSTQKKTKGKVGRPENPARRNLRLFLWVYFTLDIPNSGKMRAAKYRGRVEDWIIDFFGHKDNTLLVRDKAVWGKYHKNYLPAYLELVPIRVDDKIVKSTEDLNLLSEEVIRKVLSNWVQDAISKSKKS